MPQRPIKDLEFAVNDASGKERIFKTWDAACGFAVALAASGQPAEVNIDVLAWTRRAAEAFQTGGGEEYDEDPEASVFQRITITAEDVGRVA